jgi:hypothetical protein
MHKFNPGYSVIGKGYKKQYWRIAGWDYRMPKDHLEMAVVTKNRNFYNCPWLLYYKSKWAPILTAAFGSAVSEEKI